MTSTVESQNEKDAGIQQVEVVQQLESIDDDIPYWKLLLKSPRLIFYTFVANSGSLLFGYDVLVGGAVTALPAFSMSFGSEYKGQLILSALWQGLWQGVNSIGIMFGAVANGYLQDRLGRRPMFSIAGIIAAIGNACLYTASDLSTVDARCGMLVAGKFIIGIGMGIAISTCQTWVSETAPPRLRNLLLGFFAFLITVGQMIAISIVFDNVLVFSPRAFKVPFASQWALSGYAVIASFIVPESPAYYMAKGKKALAVKALHRLHGPKRDISAMIQAIESTLEHEKETSQTTANVSYKEIFKGSDLRRTRITALLNTLQQLIGVSLVANSNYFFITSGMTPNEALTISQIGVGLSMVGTIIAWFIMGKFGTRRTILVGFAVCCIFFAAMGVAGFFQSNRSALRFIGVAIILSALTSNLSVGTAYPIVAGEISSVRLRSKTLGFGFVVNAFFTWLFSFTVPYMFNADQGNLGGKVGFVFMGTCIIGFILSWIDIPETKGITYANLDYMFKTHVPTRQFRRKAVENIETVPGSQTLSG